MERAVFERMAEVDDTHWWFVARRRILSALIERLVRPPKHARILEIGCGTGHNLEMLGRFGRVEGSELDMAARALANIRHPGAIKEARLPDLSMFASQSYDLIALLDVLEHVEDDFSSLRAIRNCLKPGGALVMTVPANPWMWSAHDEEHHHFRRYTKRQLAELFASSGFEVDLLSYFNSLLFPLIAAARIVGKLRKNPAADDKLPGPIVNAILTTVFGFEAALVCRVGFPFGVSLVAVARRSA